MKLVVALILIVVVAGAPAASGAQTGRGELGPDYVRATAHDLGSGSFPGSGVPARAPSVESPFTWSRAVSPLVCVLRPDPVPPQLVDQVQPILGPTAVAGEVLGPGTPVDVPSGAVALDRSLVPPDAVVVGDLVYEVGTQAALALVVPRCVRPGIPMLGEPPSPAEIWQQVPLPRAHVHASPPGTSAWPGITRLASLFWGDHVGDAAARVSLRGFDVNVVAHPIAYAWSFGDGTTTVGSNPGSAAVAIPATFQRRGDYAVDLYVVWEGHAQVSFAGVRIADEDLGTVTLSERTAYHVAEIRALLRTTAGRG